MKYFRLRQPPSGSGQATTWLEGNHRWRIPYLACPACGKNRWADGVAYSAADLNGLPWADDTAAAGQADALPPERVLEITRAIRARLPYELAVPPGTNLGAFKGKAKKPLLDFAWYFSFPFVTEAALGELRSAGITDLFAVPCEIQYQTTPKSCYLELQIEHEVSLVGGLRPEHDDPARHSRCAVCGRDNGWLPHVIVIDSASIPSDVNLMRCRQYPPLRIISERLADAIRECKLKGAVIEQVELAGNVSLAGQISAPHITTLSSWSGLEGRFRTFESDKPKRVATRREPSEREQLQLGASKLGGMPHLPTRVRWPVRDRVPLSFLAQVNLAELQGHCLGSLVPSNGWIYVFYDVHDQPWGYEAGDSRGWSVLFFNGSIDALRRRHQHTRFEIEVLPEWPVHLIPEPGEADADGLRLTRIGWDLREGTIPDIRPSIERIPQHKLLGSPDCVQSADMREELHVTATTAFPDVNARGPEDWILLLQLDSDSEAGMSWADEGRLYCWIAKRELAAGDFRHAWFMLQSY